MNNQAPTRKPLFDAANENIPESMLAGMSDDEFMPIYNYAIKHRERLKVDPSDAEIHYMEHLGIPALRIFNKL